MKLIKSLTINKKGISHVFEFFFEALLLQYL